MIVPMVKVSLMMQEKYQTQSLEKLRGTGLVHVNQSEAISDELSRVLALKARAEGAALLIKPYKTPELKKSKLKGRSRLERRLDAGLRRGRRDTDKTGSAAAEPYSLDAINAPERINLVDLMLDMGRERKALEEREAFLAIESGRLSPWGEFSPDQFKEINQGGYPLFLYEISRGAYENLPPEIKYIKFHETKTTVQLLVLDKEIPGLYAFKLPDKPLSRLNEELEELREELKALEEKIKSFASRRPALEKEMAAIDEDIQFNAILAGLDKIEDLPSGLGVSYLQGYLPLEDLETLKAAAAKNNWALSIEEPTREDKPPTLLRNKPAARIIKPLLDFLGTIPGYWEFDISPSYLVFFSLFFAMIFGDAAYGLLILMASLILGIGFIRKGGPLPDVIKLMILLSFTTIIWGSINGAWFAIPHNNLPPFLRALIIPPFNNTGPLTEFPLFLQYTFRLPADVPTDVFKTRWSIQFLCFTVALIQLTYARAKRIKRLLPSLSAVAQAGWLLLLAGLYYVVLTMLLRIPSPPFLPWLIGIGAALILVFSEQNGGNFLKNAAKGFSNLFSIFLKAVGCFADIISYIRLFAVGLAGSNIGQIFNSMAVPSEGFGSFGLLFVIRFLIAALLLGFGHGLNLALTALSVVVHGVRLNLLEYAGNHLEMEWSGYSYKPFVSKIKNREI